MENINVWTLTIIAIAHSKNFQPLFGRNIL